MKIRSYLYSLFISTLIVLPIYSRGQSIQDSIARHFLELNREGKYEESVKFFDKSLFDRISPSILKQAWEKPIVIFGKFQQVTQCLPHGPDTIIEVASFEKAALNILFIFSSKNLIKAFYIIKVTPKTTSPKNTGSDTSKFKQENLILKTSTGNIYGTLMLPSKELRIPIAIIIPGSGPIDRNGNTLVDTSNIYKLLAEALAKGGIASLRYDKRGVGASKNAVKNIEKLTFGNYVEDAIGWINLIKADKRFSKVIIIGHSEGSLIGMIAAEKAAVAAFISLEGPGEPLDSLLLKQLKRKLNSQDFLTCESLFTKLKEGKTMSIKNPSLVALFPFSIQPFLISLFHYDPSKEISKLNIPVLIIQGNNDLNVPVQDAERLHAAYPSSKLIIIDHMTHMLRNATSDDTASNLNTYNNPSLPLNNLLLTDMMDFIKFVQ